MHRIKLSGLFPHRASLQGILFGVILLYLGACSFTPALGSEPDTDTPSDPTLADLEVASPKRPELVFSAVKETSSAPQTVTLQNVGTAPLELSALTFGGPDAASFAVTGPDLPATVEPGATAEVVVTFAPNSAGTRSATLEVQTSGSGSLGLDLYGLGSEGEQGSNEPTLSDVVKTLGYDVDVGSNDLELGRIAASIGDEILAPTFRRAGDKPVTLTVVARYGPNEVFPYGYFPAESESSADSEPALSEVGTIAAEDAQRLLPPVASGSTAFDPGDATFGIFGQAGGATQYSIDDLNTGEITHTMRVYPLKDRRGLQIPNAFLVGLEEASNGDYQDVVMVLTNVVPLGADGEEVPLE